MSTLAIDPGTTRSAWVLMTGERLVDFGILGNDEMLDDCRRRLDGEVVIEQVASYGMPVGAEVFETVYWSGRFAEAAHPLPVHRLTRKAIVTHLCGSARAKDPNVRAALIDRYGGPDAIRKGGALHGVSRDVWAALALAVAFLDGVRAKAA